MRNDKVFHPTIDNIFSVVCMWRQWIFIIRYREISNWVDVEHLLLITFNVFVPSSVYFWVSFYRLSCWGIFRYYWLKAMFCLLKSDWFYLLRRVLFYIAFEVVRKFLIAITFATSSKETFRFRCRVINCL